MKTEKIDINPKLKASNRPPSFDSGNLAEPLLIFGGQHLHPDPKTGLGLYGPYTFGADPTPTPSKIIVGLVGPPAMIANAETWLQACSSRVQNQGNEPFLYPHFPGFNEANPFQSILQYGDTWREIVRPASITSALSPTNFFERIKQVVTLYVSAISVLSERDPKPQVILCCIPQEIIDVCTVRGRYPGDQRRRRTSPAEKRARKSAEAGQTFLFPQMDPSLGVEGMQDGHENLRRGIKAEAMKFGIPTQLVWPRTLTLTNNPAAPGEARVQDPATRAWNFATGLYHKAGGAPWRLSDTQSGTCYVGISFYKELTGPSSRVRTSMAQAFTSAGDGYILRGSSFEWDSSRHGNSPHLDSKSASALIHDVIDLYKRQNRGALPSRVVVHKSSKYWEEELAGFRDATKIVPQSDFVAFGRRDIQFYRPGDYPPLRGTFVRFSDTDLLLYTMGYIPYLRTYPGARAPQPLNVVEHFGDSPWSLILQEILGLTKMNWNTADFASGEPITLAFSRRVGAILAELPSQIAPRPEYRFYM